MIVIGLVILALVAMVCAGVVVGGAQMTTLHVDRLMVHGTTATFFFIGAGTALATLLGLWCVVAGIRRSVLRRHARQEHDGLPDGTDSAEFDERAHL